VHAAILLW